MTNPTAIEKPAKLPEADGDFYLLSNTLSKEDNALRLKVRAFMETEVQPVINDYWSRDEFPFELLPKFKSLGIAGLPIKGYGCPGKSTTMMGFLMMELARVDASISTFFGVHTGLAMGSIDVCGSEEQKRTLAAAHGSVGEDRLVRPDGARSRFRRLGRSDDHRETRRRFLDSQRAEEVDRQLHLGRP